MSLSHLTDSVLLGSNSSLSASLMMAGENRPSRPVNTSESIVLDQSYYPAFSATPNANPTDTQLPDDEIIPSATSSHLPALANVSASPMIGEDSLQNYSTVNANLINLDDLTPANTTIASHTTNTAISTPSHDLNFWQSVPTHDNDTEAGPTVNPTVNPTTNSGELVPEKVKVVSGTLSKTPLLRKPVIYVGTHDGRFHADEVMGVTCLKILYDLLGEKIQLFRSRDPEILNKCDIVLDVGQVYDPSKRRLDHHQKSCSETFYDSDQLEEKKRSRVLLSSAGMTWKEFGKIIVELYLSSQYGDTIQASDIPSIIEQGYNKIYNNIVKETDAHDNGQSMLYEECDKPEIYRYKKNLDLGNTIAKLNNGTSKDSQVSSGSKESKEEEVERRRKEAAERKNNQFVLATEITELTLRIHMDSILEEIVRETKDLPVLKKLYDERKVPYLLDIPANVSSDTKLINKVDHKQELLYTVYYQEHSKVWSFGTMQVPGQQFVNRKNLLSMEVLKERLTPEEFSQVVFVHKALFCGSAKNHDLAVKICKMSGEEPLPAIQPLPEPAQEPKRVIQGYDPILRSTIVPATASIVLLFVGYKLIKYAFYD